MINNYGTGNDPDYGYDFIHCSWEKCDKTLPIEQGYSDDAPLDGREFVIAGWSGGEHREGWRCPDCKNKRSGINFSIQNTPRKSLWRYEQDLDYRRNQGAYDGEEDREDGFFI